MLFVWLGLGTNQGDRVANLRAAIEAISAIDSVSEYTIQRSPIYETAPMYVTDQPRFLNMALSFIMTQDMDSQDLLLNLKIIEADLGRDLSAGAQRYGPRPIDIDILLLAIQFHPRPPENFVIVDTPELVVPHPRLAERAFALFPLRDIAPKIVHPILQQTIAELAAKVEAQDITKIGYLEEIEQGLPVEQMRWIEFTVKPPYPIPPGPVTEAMLDESVWHAVVHGETFDRYCFLAWFRSDHGKETVLQLIKRCIAELRHPTIHIPIYNNWRDNLISEFERFYSVFESGEL